MRRARPPRSANAFVSVTANANADAHCDWTRTQNTSNLVQNVHNIDLGLIYSERQRLRLHHCKEMGTIDWCLNRHLCILPERFCKKRPEFGHCVSQRRNVITL